MHSKRNAPACAGVTRFERIRRIRGPRRWKPLLSLASSALASSASRRLSGHLFVLELIAGALEFTHALPQPASEFGNLLGSEQEQDDHKITAISGPPRPPMNARVFDMRIT